MSAIRKQESTSSIEFPAEFKWDASGTPLVAMFHRWSIENQSALRDALIFLVLGGGTFLFLISHDFTELFFEFTRQHEELELDELLFALMFVLALYLPAFAARRWYDATRFLRESNTDSLTKLANRRRGWDVLEREMSRAERHNTPLSVILFDIDGFKDVNDRHGHMKGDRLLENLSDVLSKQMRATDLLVRWGGEEFLVILSETDRAGAAQMAERLRRCVATECGYGSLRVTASFGVAEWQPKQGLDQLIAEADSQLYAAKEAGKNRVAWATSFPDSL